jgi:hypothetical protein
MKRLGYEPLLIGERVFPKVAPIAETHWFVLRLEADDQVTVWNADGRCEMTMPRGRLRRQPHRRF